MFAQRLAASALRIAFALSFVLICAGVAWAQSAIDNLAVGDEPTAVAVNHITNRIYVSNSNSNTVTVIEGAGHARRTIPVGVRPHAIAVNTVTNRIYVANEQSANVTVIDGSNETISNVATGRLPAAIAVDEVRDRVFVASFFDDTVTIIEPSGTATLNVGQHPVAVAVNPSTGKAYVANSEVNTVTVISADNSMTTVLTGLRPADIAIHFLDNRIFVVNHDSNDLTVIDGASNVSNTTAGNPPALNAPSRVVVSPGINRVYVLNEGSNDIVAFNTTTLQPSIIPLSTLPFAITVNRVTRQLFVTHASNDAVTVINGATENIDASFEVGRSPVAVAVNETTNRAYTANSRSASVTVIAGGSSSPVIDWPAPAAITLGTPLSGTQLNATASLNGVNVPGTFVYSPAAGTILPEGTHTLSVTFTPDDTTLLRVFATTTITASLGDFRLSPGALEVHVMQGDTAGATLTVTALGNPAFNRLITFRCQTLPGFDVPAFVSCDSPTADFRGNTNPDATRNVTISIFTDGRRTIAAQSSPSTAGMLILSMLPVVGLMLSFPSRRWRRKPAFWLLSGLLLILMTPGCANTRPAETSIFQMRIQGIAEDGGPVHSVDVRVTLNPLVLSGGS